METVHLWHYHIVYVCGSPYVAKSAHFHETSDKCYATGYRSEKKNLFSINSNNKHRSLDYAEGVDSKLLRNVGIRNKLPDNTASRQKSP